MVRRGARIALALALGAAAGAACASSDVSGGDIDASVDAVPLDACVPAAETCNGADDDCDEQIDEDFATLGEPCTAGSGACVASGNLICATDGSGVACDATPGDGTEEVCNDIDDDCDGPTDEGFMVGTMCDGPDADLCAEGAIVCGAAGGSTCADTTGDTAELCNTMDDDCDAATDEGFDLGMPCDGGDSDACVEGVIVCGGDGSAICDDATASTVEVCNSVDDDCAGGVDNGFPVGNTCTAGTGLCQRNGSLECSGDGSGTVCNATPGAPSAETCGDSIDQDCNGADPLCPTNDLVTGAINVSGGGTFTVDLSAAHNNHDHVVAGCGNAGGRDVFYQFSLPAAEVVYLDTFGSNFDTTIRIFNGACTALGANVTCFDDACSTLQTQGAIQLNAGTYCLILDQYSSLQTNGTAVLNVTWTGRTGTALTATSGTLTGTTAGAADTTQASACAVGFSQGPDVGYHFMVCPSTTRTVTAATCTTPTSWDSILYLRRAPAGTSDLGCNDDGASPCGSVSPIRLSSLPGTAAVGPGLFWLTVDGFNGASGAYTLDYNIQ